MDIDSRFRSPNFNDVKISVEFVVIHYTATSLVRTLEIFTTPQMASAHIVIDRDGVVYELVPCLTDDALRAWHAGVSRFVTPDGHELEGFNDRAIGIELVNINGNVFPYTDRQYSSLVEVLRALQQRYPTLVDPNRVIGHEEIAGFRGKCDPGLLFDWERLYAGAYPAVAAPARSHRCSLEQAARLKAVMESLGIRVDPDGDIITPPHITDNTFEALSSLVEALFG